MKKFTKKVENFTCQNCGKEVVGNGYTNHCPHCLWSKHVDINPGDRASECGGLMKVVKVEHHSGDFTLTHKCVLCGYEKRNISSREDDSEVILDLVRKLTSNLR